MKIAVLTTEAAHHAYYARELARLAGLEAVFSERRIAAPSFETRHPFEDERDAYEREFFFGGREASLSEFSSVRTFESFNDPEAVRAMRDMDPDLAFVFGAGKLSREAVGAFKEGGLLNLHGGDPEEYRGLDSHLWAIYHRDFDGLIVTLHQLNEALDDGPIVSRAPASLSKGMPLSHLRARTAEACVTLSLAAIGQVARSGFAAACPQKKKGRYYSFMPAPLKGLCVERFQRHTDGL